MVGYDAQGLGGGPDRGLWGRVVLLRQEVLGQEHEVVHLDDFIVPGFKSLLSFYGCIPLLYGIKIRPGRGIPPTHAIL